MSLEKISLVDLVEVLQDGCVQVRNKISVLENGRPIGTSFHRHIVAPGDDYSEEDPKVKAICAAVHTSEVVLAYKVLL